MHSRSQRLNMTEKRIDINLQIAETPLSLKDVSIAEEGIFREAAKGINERWKSRRKNYPTQSPNEALAIVALIYARAYLTLKSNVSESEKLLTDFDRHLDEMLNEDLMSNFKTD